MLRLGFSERIRGDHHIYARADVNEIIDLQPRRGKAKPYQVRQVRDLIRSTASYRIMKSKYEISICWSDEDDAYVATVPDLPGCMADGASYQEALAAAERAIELWIQTARELGRDIPQPRARRVSA